MIAEISLPLLVALILAAGLLIISCNRLLSTESRTQRRRNRNYGRIKDRRHTPAVRLNAKAETKTDQR